MAEISYDQFLAVDLRIGRIVEVEDFSKARQPAYKLRIDFGELGIKRSSAQITRLYSKDQLVGRLIVAVVNFPPKQVADFFSEVLVLGTELPTGEIVLLEPDRDVPLGGRIS